MPGPKRSCCRCTRKIKRGEHTWKRGVEEICGNCVSITTELAAACEKLRLVTQPLDGKRRVVEEKWFREICRLLDKA
jgi:hypothetical protein